jgi:2-oxoglutarate dehydrogenase E2 component (dihydrolipoamide succinyltransferase)
MAEMVDIVMPDSEEEGTEATMENWLIQEGEYIDRNEPVAEVATDKVTMEVAAPVCGYLREILVDVGDPVEPGMLLGRLEHSHEENKAHREEKPEEKETAPAPKDTTEQKIERTEVRLSPAVKKLIRDHSLDPDLIPGSGKGGRITVSDVEGPVKGPEFEADLLKHNNMRLSIADHMIRSALETTPHVTAVFEADLSRIIAHRKRHKEDFAKRGARLTFTAYFTYACVEACRHVPVVNGQWMEDGIKLFDHCNVGIATSLEDQGLIVPVIKNAQDLDLYGIAEKLGDLAERARSKRLGVSDVKDGTITITNHGVTGSLIGTPIINQPQSAIVGIGKMEKRVKVVEVNGTEEFVAKPMCYVTLTFDHRGIDGYTGNLWLSKFVETLEQW